MTYWGDGRTWFKHEPCFLSIISVAAIHPDEWVLAELGPRVAVESLKGLMEPPKGDYYVRPPTRT